MSNFSFFLPTEEVHKCEFSDCSFEYLFDSKSKSYENCDSDQPKPSQHHIGFEREIMRQQNMGLRNSVNFLPNRYDYALFPGTAEYPEERSVFPDIFEEFRNQIPQGGDRIVYHITQEDVKQLYGVTIPAAPIHETHHDDLVKSTLPSGTNPADNVNQCKTVFEEPNDYNVSVPYPIAQQERPALFDVLQLSFNWIINMLEEMGVPKVHSETMYQIIETYQGKFGIASSCFDDSGINKPLIVKKILTSTLYDFLKHLKMSGDLDYNVAKIYETVIGHISDCVDMLWVTNFTNNPSDNYVYPKIHILEFVTRTAANESGVSSQITGTAQISVQNVCSSPAPPSSQVPLPVGFTQYSSPAQNIFVGQEENNEELSKLHAQRQNSLPNVASMQTRMITPTLKMMAPPSKFLTSVSTTSASTTACSTVTSSSQIITSPKVLTSTFTRATAQTTSKVMVPSVLDYDSHDSNEKDCDDSSYTSDVESSTYSQAVKKSSKQFNVMSPKQMSAGNKRGQKNRVRTNSLTENSSVRSHASERNTQTCVFCKKNGESHSIYKTHILRDPQTKVITCPVLRSYKCTLCGATGDFSHTITYCPQNKGNKIPSNIVLKSSGHYSNGALRKPKPSKK